jgi:protoporphyrinogen oxidase
MAVKPFGCLMDGQDVRMIKIEYLVIGAGPTGLGAATRLHEKGLDWALLEAENQFGGLSMSFKDEQGFTWDLGGHVQFSHYETFDRYMDLALGKDGWYTHQRESWVWIKKRFVPYPFQNNLHRLDPADRWACVEGLLEAWQREQARSQKSDVISQTSDLKSQTSARNFEEWMFATFGPGITELFMYPYNFKVWAYPPSQMDAHWIGERVSVPGLGGVIKSICLNRDEVSWGPNKVFRFPKKGGTGAVWQAIGRMLPPERVHLNTTVAEIDVKNRRVLTRDGTVYAYSHLISTMPLNHLIRLAPGVVEPARAADLLYSSTNVVGVGLEGQPPEHLRTKCWMYFPDGNSPYYRVTVFTNYSPENAARPGEQWSLMTETSESPMKPVQGDSLMQETLLALEEDGLIVDRNSICSVVHRRLNQGYPTPFLGRDGVVDPMLRAFEAVGIFSRGRFGAWKYEVANQDHSFAQGYECVERLAAGGGSEWEPTLFDAEAVNSRRNP